jgi:hypothetical protein
MSERKNFNYRNASVAEIAEQFKKSTRQCIWGIRNKWKNDVKMSEKVEEAYRLYKFSVLEEKLSTHV